MNRLLNRRILVEVATFCVVAQGLAVLATMAVVAMGPTSPLTAVGLFCVAVFTCSLVVGFAAVIRMGIDDARRSAERGLFKTIDERNERIAVLVREVECRRAWPDEREIASEVSRLRSARDNSDGAMWEFVNSPTRK